MSSELIATVSESRSELPNTVSRFLFNQTGIDNLCTAIESGVTDKEIALLLKCPVKTLRSFYRNASKKENDRVYRAILTREENSEQLIKAAIIEDIKMQNMLDDVVPDGDKEFDKLMQDKMKLAMLVEKRVKNSDIALKGVQRTISRVVSSLEKDAGKGDSGITIENSVIISNNAVNFLPD